MLVDPDTWDGDIWNDPDAEPNAGWDDLEIDGAESPLLPTAPPPEETTNVIHSRPALIPEITQDAAGQQHIIQKEKSLTTLELTAIN